LKYYLIAGERSGDLHGGNLIRAIARKDAQASFRCFGGEYMQEAGAELVVHYAALAMMGFAEVISNLSRISRLMQQCKKDIKTFQPDVVILIDFGGFNLRLAKFLKANNYKVYYYISPKVWAWNQGRARKIKKLVDKMFVILPFEKAFYQRYNWEVDYVGNPVLDAVKQFTPTTNFKASLNLSDNPLIAVLPGSRKQELKRIVPVLAQIARQNQKYNFVIAAIDTLNKEMYADFAQVENVKLVYEQTFDLLKVADAAIVTSGTATLETALFKVPQVVVYKTSAFNYAIGSRLVRVSYISLPNLIANKEVVKELLQDEMNPQGVSIELEKLIEDQSYRNEMLKNYNEIYRSLDTGSASENTAELIVNHLKN
jgi:lipid-A-disaccharide synthase